MALTKWASTKSKIDPVIDELLAGDPSRRSRSSHQDLTLLVPAVASPSIEPVLSASEHSTESRLRELQRLKDEDLITEEEFAEKRRGILDEI